MGHTHVVRGDSQKKRAWLKRVSNSFSFLLQVYICPFFGLYLISYTYILGATIFLEMVPYDPRPPSDTALNGNEYTHYLMFLITKGRRKPSPKRKKNHH